MTEPFPAPLSATAPSSLPLEVTASVIGAYRWIESALHATLGSWVATAAIPAAQIHLDGESMRHAWHAELWTERLPVLRDVDPDIWSQASPASAALMAVLEGGVGPGEDGVGQGPVGVLCRLAGLARVVLPRLEVTYRAHLDVASPVADGPLRRTLQLVTRDIAEDRLLTEQLVQHLMAGVHDVEMVHQFTRQLEAATVQGGVGPGLVDLPATLVEG